MKLTKKKVFVSALAVCLVAILSFGTLAWFTDTDSVKNDFYMATSNQDPDAIFSVDVWEYVDGDTDNKDQDGAEFKNIVPGDRFHKEPHIENTGSYDQWIRVKVTATNADAWIAALGNGFELDNIFEGHDETAWTRYDDQKYDPNTNTIEYVYYLNYKLEPGKDATLFHTVVIPSELTQEDMSFIGGKFELQIVAEAIQADNTGSDAYTAFTTIYDAQP